MKKLISIFTFAVFVCFCSIYVSAAHTLTPAEEELLNKFNFVVELNLSKFESSENARRIAAEYENEARNALLRREVALDENAVAELSGVIDHVNGELEGLVTSAQFIEIAQNIVGEVNSVANKYGMFVTIDNYGYAHVSTESSIIEPEKKEEKSENPESKDSGTSTGGLTSGESTISPDSSVSNNSESKGNGTNSDISKSDGNSTGSVARDEVFSTDNNIVRQTDIDMTIADVVFGILLISLVSGMAVIFRKNMIFKKK